MSEMVLPCPHCGGDAETKYWNGGWPDACYSVQCKSWRCPGKTSSGDERVAAAAWNTRAELNQCWEQINALGGTLSGNDDDFGRGVNHAVEQALSIIEKLGGKDPCRAALTKATGE